LRGRDLAIVVPVRPSGPTFLRGWGRSSSAATVDSWSRVRLSSSRVTTAGPARSSRSRSPRPAGEPSSASPGSCPRGIRSPTALRALAARGRPRARL